LSEKQISCQAAGRKEAEILEKSAKKWENIKKMVDAYQTRRIEFDDIRTPLSVPN
jgi:hypothetical protein